LTPPDVNGAQLLASEELNRAIVGAMPCGVVHVRTDGSIVSANAEALRLLGLSYDEITQKYTSDFEPETFWEDGRPCPAEEYPVSRALRTGERQPGVVIGVRTPAGPIYWAIYTAVPLLGSRGEVTGAVVTFLDVTEQRSVSSALRQSEERLRSVVESVPGYVLLVDRELRIQFCSRFLTGLSPAQVYGQSILGFSPEAERAFLKEKLESVLATGLPQVFEMMGDAWIGGGTYRLSAGAVRDGTEITSVTLVAEDVTTQKEMESRLLLSERLAAIGTLAAGVAHEINNPLTYLMGNLELIERILKQATPEVQGRVTDAIEGAERIAAVVRDLMSFSQSGEGPHAPVSVSLVIDKAVRMAHHAIQRRARFVCEPIDVPDIVGGQARVSQVLLNLLINAAHAIPSGDAERNEIRVAARVVSDGLVRISVSDTGKGIDRALLARIFDPFVTTKPLGEGTGLGLYVCHNIVTALGGAIWVESKLGVGSTFHVDLPVFKAKGAPPKSPDLSQTVAILGGDGGLAKSPERVRKLLIVDDEPSITTFMRHALSPYDVATVRCGRDGIAALEGRTFDAVLCDLVMPDLSGVQVYEYVRAHRPELAKRFLFITGGAIGEVAPELSGFAVPILYKPFSVRDLRAAVDQLLSGS
jgi:PAS domain S-box-containing protein